MTAGAVPPLNGGYTVAPSATFQAGGAVWSYNSETIEKLGCVGPLSTSVHIKVNHALPRYYNEQMQSSSLHRCIYAVVVFIHVGVKRC